MKGPRPKDFIATSGGEFKVDFRSLFASGLQQQVWLAGVALTWQGDHVLSRGLGAFLNHVDCLAIGSERWASHLSKNPMILSMVLSVGDSGPRAQLTIFSLKVTNGLTGESTTDWEARALMDPSVVEAEFGPDLPLRGQAPVPIGGGSQGVEYESAKGRVATENPFALIPTCNSNGLTYPTPPRSSVRLASTDKGSIILKAMSRKARMREGEERSPTDCTVRKVVSKCQSFGINLDTTEVKTFAEFVAARA